MQLFAITYEPRHAPDPSDALRLAAGRFPPLREATVEGWSSASGRLRVGAVGHPEHAAPSRRYRAASDTSILLYDGLPVATEPGFDACDAHELLARWETVPATVDGSFAAVKVDLEGDVAEVLLDSLGMVKVFQMRAATGGWIVSNSVAVMRTLSGNSRLDSLGAASLLTAGWVIGGRTLIDGVVALQGGSLHHLSGSGLRSTPILDPASVAPARLRGEPADERLARRLVAMTKRAGAASPLPTRCGLTAGRDSRVLLAMGLAADLELDCYTGGSADSTDAVFAASLARAVGVNHRVKSPEIAPSTSGLAEAAESYVGQTDGLANLAEIGDWLETHDGSPSLGVRLWGVGGEIGRGAIGLRTPLAAVMPGLRSSERLMRNVLDNKVEPWAPLLSPEAASMTTASLHSFAGQRLDEGWRPSEALEAYYAFERVSNWGALSTRRAAATCDVFSPFTSRDFIRRAFSLSAGERYVETLHYSLLSQLNQGLRDMPFEEPWRRQRPGLAPALIAGEAAGEGLRRVGSRWRPRRERRRISFGHAWFEAGIDVHREVCLSFDDSPIWELAHRHEVAKALSGPPESRQGRYEVLCRLATIFWSFHVVHDSLGGGVHAPVGVYAG
jgi:asparagine synthase (glutamine-hydrolysing)